MLRIPTPLREPCLEHENLAAVKELLFNFLERSNWKKVPVERDIVLRSDIRREIELWSFYDDALLIDALVDVACGIAEASYLLLPPPHRRFVALYTACTAHVDDRTGRQDGAAITAAQRFGIRFARGEPQGLPALDVLARLLKDTYDLFPALGANTIISNTVDGMTAMYVEASTVGVAVVPGASKWPDYFRIKTGLCAAYTHFCFLKEFEQKPGAYVQMVPLSFYKEELAHESTNYICLRAVAEHATSLDILRKVVEETLDNMRLIDATFSNDERLQFVWESLKQVRAATFLSDVLSVIGYISFHFATQRYRLEEVGMLGTIVAVRLDEPISACGQELSWNKYIEIRVSGYELWSASITRPGFNALVGSSDDAKSSFVAKTPRRRSSYATVT
ncbi:uncharacterized protein BXZ73DRAFT_75543 [Epithele typhae]|uniref:uncharacterized protein n=1 Tax=Epithele typhae TaxID=378194 RepID=UPI00200853AB|nr:uncharacterized protein BXZ73DRAFT_75543 [Epithele typhae]KAH9940449.1 hypothetical protein BXZ73DRAFT_75543 [Epithele typhae]